MGLTLFCGDEENVNWKLVCHFVQAQSSFVSEMMGHIKKGNSIGMETCTKLIECSSFAFRTKILELVKQKVSEQQYVGIYGPLLVGTLGVAMEVERDTQSLTTDHLISIIDNTRHNPKLILSTLTVRQMIRCLFIISLRYSCLLRYLTSLHFTIIPYYYYFFFRKYRLCDYLDILLHFMQRKHECTY